MRDPDFSEELCAFIQLCTPSVEAVELLLLLARQPDHEWTPRELSEALRPAVVGEATVRDYLGGYASCRLVEKRPDGRYAFAPVPAPTAGLIAALEKAYNERPVSLVRVIYTLKEKKIRSFADAFKLRKG